MDDLYVKNLINALRKPQAWIACGNYLDQHGTSIGSSVPFYAADTIELLQREVQYYVDKYGAK